MLASHQTTGRSVELSTLRASIARLERGAAADAGVVPLCEAIDRQLPGGGLARGALHDVLAADAGAAAAFCALLLARATGTVLWIDLAPDAWPPGLSAFGLDPADLVLVRASKPVDALWAFEEALRSPAIGGAVLVVRGRPPDMVASRRLQLAAETGRGIGLLLLPDLDVVPSSTARTRWRVEGTTGADHCRPNWRLSLLRCNGGRPGRWSTTWNRDAAELELADTGRGRQAILA